jgi:hypothetical protein
LSQPPGTVASCTLFFAMAEIKGTAAFMKQAEAGMALFKAQDDGPLELDVPAAEQYKVAIEERIAALEAEAAQLTGKDNKKERAAKGKEVSELKAEPRYIDACKVAKGLEPKNGNFVKGGLPAPNAKESKPVAVPEAPAAVEEDSKKDKKPSKKMESAGLSPGETKELDTLKQNIIDRKNQLKAEGLSGGQQNKDAQIVEWVTRMNVLKEKQEPGSTTGGDKKDKDAGKKKTSKAPLSQDEQKDMGKLEQEIETYKARLKAEFGYSKKEMAADPDLQEMETRLKELQKRSG